MYLETHDVGVNTMPQPNYVSGSDLQKAFFQPGTTTGLEALSSAVRQTIKQSGGFHPTIWFVYDKSCFSMHTNIQTDADLPEAFLVARAVAGQTGPNKVFTAFIVDAPGGQGSPAEERLMAVSEAVTPSEHAALGAEFYIDLGTAQAVRFDTVRRVSQAEADQQNPLMAKMFHPVASHELDPHLTSRVDKIVAEVHAHMAGRKAPDMDEDVPAGPAPGGLH